MEAKSSVFIKITVLYIARGLTEQLFRSHRILNPKKTANNIYHSNETTATKKKHAHSVILFNEHSTPTIERN